MPRPLSAIPSTTKGKRLEMTTAIRRETSPTGHSEGRETFTLYMKRRVNNYYKAGEGLKTWLSHKSPGCREPRLHSQHPQGRSQPSGTGVGNPVSSSDLLQDAYICYTDISNRQDTHSYNK